MEEPTTHNMYLCILDEAPVSLSVATLFIPIWVGNVIWVFGKIAGSYRIRILSRSMGQLQPWLQRRVGYIIIIIHKYIRMPFVAPRPRTCACTALVTTHGGARGTESCRIRGTQPP